MYRRNIVGALNGRMLSIKKEDKPLYHAAACIMSNYMVTIAHAAVFCLKVSELMLDRRQCFCAIVGEYH
jgi:predicted short-subunit dehydrogenase-like oxidoreductase (DUF2520 family)